MRLTDAYNSKAIAIAHNEVASNSIAYLGEGLFPAQKKAGLDLKWIVTSAGLPVSLAPSAFDTVSTIRSREGIEINETEMAYFKESMLVKEVDEQEILRAQDSADPYAQDVIKRIYNDAETLIAGANVVPERMRMSLLSSNGGHPSISISANGATYAYNYDPNNKYSATNYLDVSTSATDKWSAVSTADPMADIEKAIDAVEAVAGSRPEILIVSKQTMNYLKQNEKIKSAILAQNATANVLVTEARVKAIFAQELQITIIVYNKQYKDEAGVAKKFYPDGFATLVPNGALGKTWFGTTPAMRSLMSNPAYDVSVVDTGISVTVSQTNDPVQTKTTVDEIVLPSFERMMETYTIKAY